MLNLEVFVTFSIFSTWYRKHNELFLQGIKHLTQINRTSPTRILFVSSVSVKEVEVGRWGDGEIIKESFQKYLEIGGG